MNKFLIEDYICMNKCVRNLNFEAYINLFIILN